MKNNLSKWTNIAKVALALIGVVACLLVFSGPNINVDTRATIEEFRDGGVMSFATIFTIIMLFLGLGLVLFFFVLQIISNPKKTLLSIFGILVAFVIFFLFYMVGSSDTSDSLNLTNKIGAVSSNSINITTAGIWTVLISLGVAVVVILASSVQRLLKR
jgi:hypothetical protein